MELVNIQYAGKGVQSQDLSQQDKKLVTSNTINSSFGAANDYIELYIYGESGQLLEIDYDASDYYPFLTNNAKNNTYGNLTLDPEKDLRNRGFNRGSLNIQYNFYTKLFNSQFGRFYWIKEISTSRLEIKLASQTISDSLIQEGFNAYQAYISEKNYYPIFYLNFGNNQTVIANNVAYTEDEDGSYLLVKLYEPLPNEFNPKSEVWIVDKVAESVSFNVSIQVESEAVDEQNKLRGPNYNIVLNNKNGQTTPYYNYNSLLTSELSSSYQKLRSYYQDKAIEINVDYSNFANFIHFSSAVERVNNFVYKLQLIESYNRNIVSQSAIIGNQTVISSSVSADQQAINNLIKNFDTYEYFLYFESSSWAWPKINTTQPYVLYSTTSSQATSFLGGVDIVPTDTTQSLLWSASYHDSTNKDILRNSIPQYVLDDPTNEPYITFVDMIGQHFDNIWIYYKDVTNRYNATNNPKTGISLDLVSDALKGLGFNLYTNSNVSDNLYYTLFGINPDGSLLPPTGSEIITNYVTSSLETLPAATIQDELYKRLYHNLPYLLKSKGTLRGVKALISTFGIPDSILTVREFGGNPIDSLDGIIDLNTSDFKVAIVTGSAGDTTGSTSLSSSLLSPYTTVQWYQGNTRLNNTNVEVGFSPSDVVNSNIVSSQGQFSLDQLIGSPGYQYSASYFPMVSASNSYFASYTASNSVWEYIRLLKFYNNALFKTIKDFVPARTNISTGIIVKSHMYERNKYARHEPILTFNDYSQSIDIGEISGSEGGALTRSTAWSGYLQSISGAVFYESTDGIEKYNGELSGSEIVVTTGNRFDQVSGFTPIFLAYYLGVPYSGDTYILGTEAGDEIVTVYGETKPPIFLSNALYQNVSSSVRSKFLLDLDYNSDQVKPVNYNAVTYSLSQSRINNFNAYSNINNPYANVQDFNYYLRRSIIPRYIGSEIFSSTYNTYTPGDQSYGKTAVIDKLKYQYAYLVDIYTASAYFPNRSNAQIKYLIDNDENVLDLTKTNQNIFDVQNVFKSGEYADIALFEYDERNPYSQQLANNPTIEVYEGGWRYLPILHNVNRTGSYQQFDLTNFIGTNISVGGSGVNASEYSTTNYVVSFWSVETEVNGCSTFGGGNSTYALYVSASYVPPAGGNVSFNVKLTVNFKMPQVGACTTPTSVTINIPSGNNKGVSTLVNTYFLTPTCNGSGGSEVAGAHWPPGVDTDCPVTITSIADAAGTQEYTYFRTNFTGSQSSIYYLSQSNEILFNTTMSYYYYYYSPFTFSSSGDIDWSSSLDPAILPFTLEAGDKISFYNSTSLGWDERFEYTIKSGPRYSGSRVPTNLTSSVMLFELTTPVNLNVFSSGSGVPTESITRSPFRSNRYIVWKHVPDETNVILKYNPKTATLVENGLLLPQYIDPDVRDNSGNVIKSLKQQNLIVDQSPTN